MTPTEVQATVVEGLGTDDPVVFRSVYHNGVDIVAQAANKLCSGCRYSIYVMVTDTENDAAALFEECSRYNFEKLPFDVFIRIQRLVEDCLKI